MEYAKLGKTDASVSRIGLGCWAIGGDGWGEVDDQESLAAIRAAMDVGINFIDTADIYGFGHSEEIVGQAIEGRRDEVFLATKVGVRRDDSGSYFVDLSREHILESIDASLARLRTDYVDLYQLHWPDKNTPVAESMESMLDLQRAGKIKHIGVSNFSVDLMDKCLELGRIETDQPPYNMFQRKIEKQIAPFCIENDISVLAYGPMAQGLLTGKYAKGHTFQPGDNRANFPYFKAENFERSLKIIDRLRPIADDLGVALSQLAVAWVLANPAVTVALCGAKRPSQIEETAAAAEVKLSDDVMHKIDEAFSAG